MEYRDGALSPAGIGAVLKRFGKPFFDSTQARMK
jgi:hypothetical protein